MFPFTTYNKTESFDRIKNGIDNYKKTYFRIGRRISIEIEHKIKEEMSYWGFMWFHDEEEIISKNKWMFVGIAYHYNERLFKFILPDTEHSLCLQKSTLFLYLKDDYLDIEIAAAYSFDGEMLFKNEEEL